MYLLSIKQKGMTFAKLSSQFLTLSSSGRAEQSVASAKSMQLFASASKVLSALTAVSASVPLPAREICDVQP